MPSADDPRANEPPRLRGDHPVAEGISVFDEQLATQRVLNLWQVPEGPFPLVTLLIILAGGIVTGLSYLYPESTYGIFYVDGNGIWLERKWWGLLGSAFLHIGILHIVFNCYWIWLLGRLVERELGMVRYLGFFLATAVFGSIAELAWSGQTGVGLSGVAYALFGFLFVNRARHPDFGRVLSDRTNLLMFGWLIACFVLTYTGIFNVANFAHVGGLVSGWLLGAAWYPRAWQKQARIACVVLGVTAAGVLFWAPWQEVWQMGHAYRALVAKDNETALVELKAIRTKNPANTWALSQEAALRSERGEYALTRDLFIQLVSATAKPDPAALNCLAWLLATCPAAEIRDGEKAVHFARQACELSAWKMAELIDTLAAAQAEAGDFTEAEKFMVMAMAAPGGGAAIYQAHLEAFRAHKPWREPPAAR